MLRIKKTECKMRDIQPGELFSMFPVVEEPAGTVGVACYIRTESRSARQNDEGIVYWVEVEVEAPKVNSLGDLWRILPAMGYSDRPNVEGVMVKRLPNAMNGLWINVWKPEADMPAIIAIEQQHWEMIIQLYRGLDYGRMFTILQRLEGLLA